MSEAKIILQKRKRRFIPSRHQLGLVLACAVSISSSVRGAPSFRKREVLLQEHGKIRPERWQRIVVGGSVGMEQKEPLDDPSQSIVSKSIPKSTHDEKDVTNHAQPLIEELSPWPCLDAVDKMLIKISLPVIATFAINPIVSASDLFFINRMGDALAVAGQSAANQVFGSVFWLTSFLPSITAILVSKEFAKGNKEGVQDAVCQALFVGIVFAAIGTSGLLLYPVRALLSVLKRDAPALTFAKPYLMVRAFSFVPSLISIVGFSAFRGQLDTTTPVKINAFSNIFHVILVPVFVLTLSMGINGAALGTLVAETISGGVYLYLMKQRHMIQMKKIFRFPRWTKLKELLVGGIFLQLRNVAFNLTFIVITRMIQAIDDTGVAPAAHAIAMQTFQVGGIVLLALSTVAQTVVPGALVEKYDENLGRTIGGVRYARSIVKRLMSWGFLLGTALGSLQILLLPLILKSTPLKEVQDAARLPAYIASVLQVINGLVFIGEGVMTGCGDFLQLAFSTGIASLLTIWTIRKLTEKMGLVAVWVGFAVFNGTRLLYVFLHQFLTGPLVPRKS